MVKGDLIIPTSNRIMTRSQARKSMSPSRMPSYIDKFTDPDQYTFIPTPLKIIKVLIEELLSAAGHQNAAIASATADFDDDGDDGWEDVPSSVLDLGLGSTKAELMAWGQPGDGQGSFFMRQRDDETQAYLTEFFVRAAREDLSGFNTLYGQLTEDEKKKLNELATQT